LCADFFVKNKTAFVLFLPRSTPYPYPRQPVVVSQGEAGLPRPQVETRPCQVCMTPRACSADRLAEHLREGPDRPRSVSPPGPRAAPAPPNIIQSPASGLARAPGASERALAALAPSEPCRPRARAGRELRARTLSLSLPPRIPLAGPCGHFPSPRPPSARRGQHFGVRLHSRPGLQCSRSQLPQGGDGGGGRVRTGPGALTSPAPRFRVERAPRGSRRAAVQVRAAVRARLAVGSGWGRAQAAIAAASLSDGSEAAPGHRRYGTWFSAEQKGL
jgi:hypothetical protein